MSTLEAIRNAMRLPDDTPLRWVVMRDAETGAWVVMLTAPFTLEGSIASAERSILTVGPFATDELAASVLLQLKRSIT